MNFTKLNKYELIILGTFKLILSTLCKEFVEN